MGALPRTLALGLIVALAPRAFADDVRLVVPDRRFGLRDGLPGQQVLGLHEAHDGSLWVGTIGGLARLGGPFLETWTSRDGLPSSVVYAIAESATGALLVGTLRGVARREGAVFVAEPGASGRVRTMLRTSSGELLALEDDRRLLRRADDATWTAVVVEGAAPYRVVHAAEHAGALWLATREHGLVELRGSAASGLRVASVRDLPGLQFVVADRFGVAALGAQGVLLIDAAGERLVPLRRGAQTGCLARTVHGRLFVGDHEHGVSELRGDRLEPVPSREALARFGVVRLAGDGAGNVWAGTVDQGRVALLTGSRVRYLRVAGADVSSFGRDPDARLWAAAGREMRRFRLDASGEPADVVRVSTPPGFERFYTLQPDADGQLVFGTASGVLVASGWRGPAPRLEPDARFPGVDSLTRVDRGPDGTLWTLAAGRLLALAPGATRARPVPFAGFEAGRELAVDAGGHLWLSDRQGGLWRGVPEARRVLPPAARVQHVYRDPEGHVIAALEDGSWHRFDATSGRERVAASRDTALGSLSTLSLVALGGGEYLGAHSGGRLSRLRLEPPTVLETVLTAVDLDETDFRFLTAHGGGSATAPEADPGFGGGAASVRGVSPHGTGGGFPPAPEPGPGFGGGAASVRGVSPHGTGDGVPPAPEPDDLWLAGMGVVAHRPLEVPLAPRRPLTIATMHAENGTADETSVRLEARPNALNLTLSLADPLSRRVRYRWRLGGPSEAWGAWTSDPVIRLANVEAGRLRFEAQGEDRWGRLATTGVALAIQAEPRFTETWGFFGLVVGALLLVSAVGHRVRLRALLHDRQRLERAVAERSADLAQRNRDLEAAHARLEEAERQIERLADHAHDAVRDLAAWARSMAADIALGLGAQRIEVFEVHPADRLAPLVPGTSAAPSRPDLAAALATGGVHALAEGELIVARGLSGDAMGALRVVGKQAWTDAERRVISRFAQQLGGALELRHLRADLESARQRRESSRRALLEQGVELLRPCRVCSRCYGPETERCEDDGSALDETSLLPRDVAGRYRLERTLATGGMGTVFEARDLRLDRMVAVKILREDRFASPADRARFENEARLSARIQHPGVVAVHDSGDLADGSGFIVLERLVGLDLSTLLARRGAASPAQAARLLRQASSGLAAAHRLGLVHRDIKPANLFLASEADGFQVKLVDFGVAKSLTEVDPGLTGTGMLLGTPAYMSPEQALGRAVDARSDHYSLGAVGFEALTGRRPFAEAELPNLLHAIVHEAPPAPSSLRPGLPAAVDEAFAAMLSKDPASRPADVEAWATALADQLEGLDLGTPGWPADLDGVNPSAATLRGDDDPTR